MPPSSCLRTLLTMSNHIPDALLLHQGPDAGTADRPGHPAARATLERTAPVLTLCGHVQWSEPLATLAHGGQVLNVDGRALVLQAS